MWSLTKLFGRLDRHLTWAEEEFDHYRRGAARLREVERWFVLEGLISMTWQAWGRFCRDLALKSCQGCATSTGIVVAKRAGATGDNRLAYEALCAVRHQTPNATRTLTYRREEPTWGDPQRFLDIVIGLAPGNASTIVASYGRPLSGPKHIQLVRNASAHLNLETFADVRSLTSFYQGSKLRHPTDIASWIRISDRMLAFHSWTDDMREIATDATL